MVSSLAFMLTPSKRRMLYPKRRPSLVFILAITVITTLSIAAQSSSKGSSLPQRDQRVEARLLSNRTHVGPGETWWVALELRHDPTWHTYWVNGGDAGVATRIQWTLPEGITAGPVQWPPPQVVKMGQLDVYGYEGTCLLLTSFRMDPKLALPDTLEIKAFVTWMMCSQTCLPGKGVRLDLRLGIKESPGKPMSSKWADQVGKAARKLPSPAPDRMFNGMYDPGAQRFTLQWSSFPRGAGMEVEDVYFFDTTQQITSNQAQKLEQSRNGWQLTLARAGYASKLPRWIEGLFRWKAAGAAEPYRWLKLKVPLRSDQGE
jgi:DsbC/DsbD-like thiol-disulfide interchange protein